MEKLRGMLGTPKQPKVRIFIHPRPSEAAVQGDETSQGEPPAAPRSPGPPVPPRSPEPTTSGAAAPVRGGVQR